MSAEGHACALCAIPPMLFVSEVYWGVSEGVIGASAKGGLYSLGQSLSNAQLFTASGPSPCFAVVEKTVK